MGLISPMHFGASVRPRKPKVSKALTQPILVGCLCGLQLCDCHTSKCDSVMRVYDDHRAKAGVMRLTEYERRCGLCEQSVIKRKLILIGVEVFDRFLTEALIEYKSIVSCPAD